jgi:hypothetical protein
VDDGLMTALDYVQFKNWRVRYHYNVLSKLPPLVFVVLVGCASFRGVLVPSVTENY